MEGLLADDRREKRESRDRESLKFRVRGCFICGGDALAGKKQEEADQQIALTQQMMSMMQQYKAQTDPFWMSRLQHGLPFMNQLTDYTGGTLAKAFAPERASVNRRLSGFGDTLPSGFKEQTNTNLNAAEGEAFDQNMVRNLTMNDQAKKEAAASLNPFQPAQIASGAAGSVLSAPPVQSGGVGNFLGGAVSGLINAGGQAGGFASLF